MANNVFGASITCLISFVNINVGISDYMIQICSGITSGRVLNGELYAQRIQKLIYMH